MQKSGLLTILFLALYTSISAQGIQFASGTWDELLAMARKENKLIYLDAYTTWCGPCKMMKNNIFPKDEVGAFYNKNFVNVQMDMEKGEGIELAKRYEVRAYPTHLIINGNGDLVHFGLGYMDVDPFLKFGAASIDPAQQYINMKARFDKGDRQPDFLRSYLDMIGMQNPAEATKIAIDYFETQSDLTTQENQELLVQYAVDPESKAHNKLLSQRDKLFASHGVGFVSNLASAYYRSGSRKGYTTDAIKAQLAQAYPEKKDLASFFVDMSVNRKNNDKEGYLKTLVGYLGDQNYTQFDYQQLNSYAWFVYENSDDISHLRHAITWADYSVSKEPQFFNYDTYAWLVYKSGDIDRAKILAKKAIELGKIAGEDTSSTEELLAK